MDRLLRGAPGTVTLTVRDTAGALTDLDAPPTVTVRDGAGVQVQTGTATHAETGSYTFSVSGVVTAGPLDLFSVTWAGAFAGDAATYTTGFETVGGFSCSIEDLRASHPGSTSGQQGLNDTVKYPDAKLIDARAKAEARFEAAAGVAVVPRYRRVTLEGTNRPRLLLPDTEIRALYSLAVDGRSIDLVTDPTAVTFTRAGVLTTYRGDPSLHGMINHHWGVPSIVDVHYEHGLDTVPGPVAEAIMTLARALYLVPSSLRDSRATAEFTDMGGFRLSIAGRDGWTGIPEVDEVIREFGRARPAVG